MKMAEDFCFALILCGARKDKKSLSMTIHFISKFSFSTLTTENCPRHKGVWSRSLGEIL
jgi:hypothetical protein